MHYTCDHSLFVLQKNRKQVRAHKENGDWRGAQHKNVLMNLTPDTRIDFLFLNLDATRLSLLHAWNRALTALCLVTHTLCHSYCSLPKKQVYLDPFCRVFFKCVHMCICACMFMYARCTSAWECACMHGEDRRQPQVVSFLRYHLSCLY